MQVTPEAGRDTAQRFGATYDWKRLVSDPAYNTQMNPAEISALFQEYMGSYIMTLAGYNARRGRVRQWVAQHGGPRDDWVECIPLAATRGELSKIAQYDEMFNHGDKLSSNNTRPENNVVHAIGE